MVVPSVSNPPSESSPPVAVEVFFPESPFGGVQVFGATETPTLIELNTGSPVYSVFGRVGAIVPVCSDYALCYAPLSAGVPAGGLTGQTLTKASDANYDLAWSNAGAGTVTNFSAGVLSPLFTTSVVNPTTTPALSFSLSNAGAHTFLGNNTAGSAPPSYVQPDFTDLAGSIAIGQIGNALITYAKIQNVSASVLLGRGAGAGAGVMQEITLGTNLSMSGTTLNATGGASPGGSSGDFQYNNGAGGLGGTNLVNLSGGLVITDATAFLLKDTTDPTKRFRFDAASIPTGTTQTIIVPNSGGSNPIIPLPDAGTSNNFLTGISGSTGVFSKARPTISNLTDLSGVSKLVGSGSGGAGVVEITLGTNLSMSGNTLNAAGGGGGNVSTSGTITTGQLAEWVTTTTIRSDTPAQARTAIGATTVGGNLITLTNPGAITFIKINADNSISTESAATHRTSLGANTVGSNIFTAANPSAITFLKVNADNSVTFESASTHRTSLGVAASGAVGSSGLTMNTARLLGRTTAAAGAIEEITVNAELSFSATALGIATAGVTYAKIQNVAAESVLCRAAGTSGTVGEIALAASQLLGRGATGDVAAIILGSGLSMTGSTLNVTSGGGNVSNSGTPTAGQTAVWTDATHIEGKTTLTGGTTGQVLKKSTNTDYDYAWATVSGTGDVVGPASATANAISIFDGTTGKLIKNSVATVADTTGQIVSGNGTTTNPTYSFSGSTNSGLYGASGGAYPNIVQGGSPVMAWASTNVNMPAGLNFGWTSTSDPMGTLDTALNRNAAGIVEVNNGTAGQYRDILARGLRSSAVTFANRIASPVEGTFQAFTDSETNSQGSAIATGGGSNHVMAYYNGTIWVVATGVGGGGGGNVSNSGTPTTGQYARWTDATHIEGVATSTVKSDLSLNNVTNDAQTKASIVPNTIPTDGQILVGKTVANAYTAISLSGSGATFSLNNSGVLTVSAIANSSLSNSAITIAGTSTSLGGTITQDTITGLSTTGLVKRTAANTLTTVTAPTGAVVGDSDTQTLSSKRINPRTSTTASTTSWTVTSDTVDEAVQTALAGDLTINAPSGTPVQGQKLILRITSNGSSHNISVTTGSSGAFRAIGVTLPTTIAANKTIYMGCIYNTDASRWDVVAVATEA